VTDEEPHPDKRRLCLGVVLLPTSPWATARGEWTRVEELGFDHGWTYDHIAWRDLADGPWFGAVPTLAAASLATRRLELGALVFSPNVRHPVTLAKDVVSLSDLSGGRLVPCVGAGGTGFDATMLGHPALTANERVERLGEFVTILDALLRTGRADHRGRFLSAVAARRLPAPKPRPALGVAANGPRTMRLAARSADLWITDGDVARASGMDREAFRRHVRTLVARFTDACLAERRDPSGLRRLFLCGLVPEAPLEHPEAFLEFCETYAGMGFTDLVVHAPRADHPFRAPSDALERLGASALAAARRIPVAT
jgi:alkanesulfonate monooxygenase SsuD/methylene tetrahydromethanopterin reductase-like flavin-dependent oxidoreductase (luciferase family)